MRWGVECVQTRQLMRQGRDVVIGYPPLTIFAIGSRRGQIVAKSRIYPSIEPARLSQPLPFLENTS